MHDAQNISLLKEISIRTESILIVIALSFMDWPWRQQLMAVVPMFWIKVIAIRNSQVITLQLPVTQFCCNTSPIQLIPQSSDEADLLLM